MADDTDFQRALALFQKAYGHQMRGDYDRAIDGYRRSIDTFPTAEAHTFLGWTYSMQGDYPQAIAECELAIAVDPDFGNPYNDIGAYLIELGRHEEAIPWLVKATRASRYEPRHFPHFNLGRAYVALGRLLDAQRAFQAALAEHPDYPQARRALEDLRFRLN